MLIIILYRYPIPCQSANSISLLENSTKLGVLPKYFEHILKEKFGLRAVIAKMEFEQAKKEQEIDDPEDNRGGGL